MSVSIVGGNELWQWDTDIYINVPSDVNSIEFRYSCNRAVVGEIVDGKCRVFDSLLQKPGNLVVYSTKNNRTVEKVSFKINERPKPDGYVYTEEDVLVWTVLREDIDELSNSLAQTNENLSAVEDKVNEMQVTLDGDYNSLANKPMINGQVLSGDKSSNQFGLQPEDYKITVTGYALSLNANRSYYEILRAFGGGKRIYCTYLNKQYPLYEQQGAAFIFVSINYAVNPAKASVISINSQNIVAVKDYNLTALSPNKLKFTGAVTGEFDGSQEITIDIPQGGGGGGGDKPADFIVTLEWVLVDENWELGSDKTPAEIYAAYLSGATCIAHYDYNIFYLQKCEETSSVFSSVAANGNSSIYKLTISEQGASEKLTIIEMMGGWEAYRQADGTYQAGASYNDVYAEVKTGLLRWMCFIDMDTHELLYGNSLGFDEGSTGKICFIATTDTSFVLFAFAQDGVITRTDVPFGGSGGITEESDPTVPSWAKASTKPTYTASEVGALPASRGDDIDANTSEISTLKADMAEKISESGHASGKTVVTDQKGNVAYANISVADIYDMPEQVSRPEVVYQNYVNTDINNQVIVKPAILSYGGRYMFPYTETVDGTTDDLPIVGGDGKTAVKFRRFAKIGNNITDDTQGVIAGIGTAYTDWQGNAQTMPGGCGYSSAVRTSGYSGKVYMAFVANGKNGKVVNGKYQTLVPCVCDVQCNSSDIGQIHELSLLIDGEKGAFDLIRLGYDSINTYYCTVHPTYNDIKGKWCYTQPVPDGFAYFESIDGIEWTYIRTIRTVFEPYYEAPTIVRTGNLAVTVCRCDYSEQKLYVVYWNTDTGDVYSTYSITDVGSRPYLAATGNAYYLLHSVNGRNQAEILQIVPNTNRGLFFYRWFEWQEKMTYYPIIYSGSWVGEINAFAEFTIVGMNTIHTSRNGMSFATLRCDTTKPFFADNCTFRLGENENLPIASEQTLGCVKPVSKTEAMSQPVGVDSAGKLWCEPGATTVNAGNSMRLLKTITTTDTGEMITIDTDNDGNSFSVKSLFIVSNALNTTNGTYWSIVVNGTNVTAKSVFKNWFAASGKGVFTKITGMGDVIERQTIYDGALKAYDATDVATGYNDLDLISKFSIVNTNVVSGQTIKVYAC